MFLYYIRFFFCRISTWIRDPRWKCEGRTWFCVSQEGATPSAHGAGCIDVGVAHGIEVGGRGLLESPTSLHVWEGCKVSSQGVVILWGDCRIFPKIWGHNTRFGLEESWRIFAIKIKRYLVEGNEKLQKRHVLIFHKKWGEGCFFKPIFLFLRFIRLLKGYLLPYHI